jgi:hypothetical protein
MIKEEKYKQLWDNEFSGLSTIKMPSYDDYVLRERMFEDYLDIFRGKNTRSKDGIQIPYPHPYFDGNGTPKLIITPKIKYIMIGECAAHLRPPIHLPGGTCSIPGGDINNTYFYNILHLKETPFLTSPQLAFGSPSYKPCPENKIKTLLDLASKGVLLIDLLPFGIIYTGSIRNRKNIKLLALERFDDIINYINSTICNYTLNDNIKISFVCSVLHSEFIISRRPSITVCGCIINIDALSNVDFDNWCIRNLRKPSLGGVNVIHNNWFDLINTIIFTNVLLLGNSRVHKYRSVGKTKGAVSPPHEVNLRFSFDL